MLTKFLGWCLEERATDKLPILCQFRMYGHKIGD